MHFIKCTNCGHLNEIKSEYLIFCSSCNKKLENNYPDWIKTNPKKNLEDYKKLMCISEEAIQQIAINTKPNKAKGIKYGIGFAIVFAIFYVLAQLGGEEIVKLFNYEKTSKEVLDQEWIKQTCGNFGLSVETPFVMTKTDLPLPENVRGVIDVMDVYDYMTEKGFKVLINSIKYSPAIGSVNLPGAASGSVNEMQKQPGVTDFDYAEEEINKGSIPGIKQTGTYKQNGISVEFINTGFAEGLILWQVVVVYQSQDEVGQIAAKRVIESIEINKDSSLQ